MSDPPRPKYRCPRCEDWGTLVAPGGRGTVPCPEPIHHDATTAPTTGEEKKNRDCHDAEH